MENTFLSICKHLREQVPDMQHTDLFNDQYNNEPKEHPYNMPATFVEFAPVADWKLNSDGSQTGTLMIQFHHVTTSVADTQNADRKSDIEQSLALKHLLYNKAVHKALQGFAPFGCTALNRIQSIPGQLKSSEFIYIEIYQCVITDNSTADLSCKVTTEVTPKLKVERPIDRPEETVTNFANPQEFLL